MGPADGEADILELQPQALIERYVQKQLELRATEEEIKHEHIECVFVCKFDTKHGNMVEWHVAHDPHINLTGIEFKAIASGLHLVESDCIYFKQGPFYGLACFHNLRVGSKEVRATRLWVIWLRACDALECSQAPYPETV
jgi:hypothetical protein